MSDLPSNGSRTQNIAASNLWSAAHRITTVIGIPLLMATASWLVVRVEAMDAALEHRDGQIAVLIQRAGEHERRLAQTDIMVDRMREIQSQRVPIFDQMVGKVSDHERRIRLLETGPSGAR